MHYLGDFLFSHWLWSMTIDVSHIVLTALFCFLILWLFFHRSLFRAKLVSLGISALSWLVFTGLVVGVLIIYLEWNYAPPCLPTIISSCDVFCNSMRLALLYALIQTSILVVMHQVYKLHVFEYVVAFWMSNILAFGVSYISLRLFGW